MLGGKHNRHSIRLKGYDYSQAGMYFVTICAKNRECLFGEIIREEMILSELGRIVQKCWKEIRTHYQNIELDEFVVMPNHVHGVIFIMGNGFGDVGATLVVAQNRAGASPAPAANNEMRAGASPAPTLGNIIGAFKSMVFNQHLKYIQINNLDVSAKVWQRNYYEHIIRNENSLEKIRNYIYNNPGGWLNDIENSTINKNTTESQRKSYYQNIYN